MTKLPGEVAISFQQSEESECVERLERILWKICAEIHAELYFFFFFGQTWCVHRSSGMEVIITLI